MGQQELRRSSQGTLLACSIPGKFAVLPLLSRASGRRSRDPATFRPTFRQLPPGGPLGPAPSTWAPYGPRLSRAPRPAAVRFREARVGALTSDAPGTFPAAGRARRGGGAGRGARMRRSASALPGSCGA